MSPDSTVPVAPGSLGGIFLEGLEDVLGCPGKEAVLDRTGLLHSSGVQFTRGDLWQVLKAINELYGPRAGLGVAQCIGRACFKYGIKTLGTEMGVNELPFHLGSPKVRIKSGLGLMANIFQPLCDEHIDWSQDQDYYFWTIKCNHSLLDAQTGTALSRLMMGVLQEFFYWAGGGKFYPIEDKTSILDRNMSCLLMINKRPLD